MARSSNIYVVTADSGEPVAAFTVKYECQRWLSEQSDREDLRVTRFRDGVGYSDTKVSL